MSSSFETKDPAEGDDNPQSNQQPPRAVVGSHRIEEEMFGRVFDSKIVSRIWHFVKPYRREVIISVGAVLVFTGTQLAIPLIIRYAIDRGLQGGEQGTAALIASLVAFAIVIIVNFGASYVQENMVGRTAERVLFDIREAMFSHLQRVSLKNLASTARTRKQMFGLPPQ